jgi:glycosyltransferase involved in cell wall biosynthesis
MVEEVFPRLADRFDITIITCRLKRSLPKREELGMEGKVKVIRVGLGFSFDKYLFPVFAPVRALFLRPDLIHAVLESYAGAALVTCRFLMPRTRRVLTLQSTNTSFLLGPIHRSALVITAISRTLQERAKKYGREDTVLIPNGIDFKSIREAGKNHPKIPGRILFVGRLEQMKGVDVLLSAFARVYREFPDSRLRIVGEGSLLGRLQAKSRSLNMADRVAFTGRIAGKELFREYAQAEIFCGLSRSEALGNVFLEAQAAGCAVVATRTGGIMDIVENGKNGLLVLPEDVAGAAGALSKLLADRELRERLAAKSREGKENYDWSKIAGDYAKVMERL